MYSQKRKSGNVCYYERYTDPLTGKRKTACVTIKPSRSKKTNERVAREALQKKISDIVQSQTNPKDIDLHHMIEKYEVWQRQNHKPQTAESSQNHMNTIEKLIGPDVIVSKLTAPIVAERLQDESAVTYNERIKRYKAMIRWAYRSDLVNDVAYLDKITRRKEPPARVKDAQKYLEHEEIDKVMAAMGKYPRWKLLTQLLILSGMRIGEAIALDKSDVDFNAREISITKTYALNTGHISTAKTDTSNRIIYMQDELLDCCRQIRMFILQEGMMYGYRSDIFFPDSDGKRLHYPSYCKFLRNITERNIGRRLTPHALRHTHTALLAEAGIPLESISRRLGHADSKVTREVYYHVTDKMKEKDRERIKNVKMLAKC